MFMLKSYLPSFPSINEARNACHRLVPWEPQLDEARTMSGGWGGAGRDLREKERNSGFPLNPGRAIKILLHPSHQPLFIVEIGLV